MGGAVSTDGGGSIAPPGGGSSGTAGPAGEGAAADGSVSGPELVLGGGSDSSISGPGGGAIAAPDPVGSAPDANGPDTGESDNGNGNGNKFMNGATADNGPITGGGASQLDFTGADPDPAAHDFLLSLMGGSDPFGPDVTVPPPQPHVHHTVGSEPATIGPDVGLDAGLGLDTGLHPHHPPHSDHAPVSALDQSAVDSVVDSAPSVSHPDSPDSPDSPDYNGNGRLTVISQPQTVTERVQTQNIPVSHDLPGKMEAVTGLPFELTASGLGLGPDTTEASHVVLHTESVQHSFTHLHATVSGEFSQTELVTVATETGTNSGAAAVTDLSHPHTQPGPSPGPATEPDYSQGSEGSENVELEDSC